MNEKYLETLPRPRLILRVGGLGNRNFGSDNGIDEHPARLIELAEKQCDKVFEELEKALSTMHLEDQMTSNLFPSDTRSFARRLYEATLGLVFGRCDRWNRSKLAGSSRSVFSAERPKITILSGTAKGGDEMIRRHAVRTGAPVDYEHIPIEVTRPSSLPGGLGIGSTPDKLECSQTGNLDRATAKQLANIARDRASTWRTHSTSKTPPTPRLKARRRWFVRHMVDVVFPRSGANGPASTWRPHESRHLCHQRLDSGGMAQKTG